MMPPPARLPARPSASAVRRGEHVPPEARRERRHRRLDQGAPRRRSSAAERLPDLQLVQIFPPVHPQGHVDGDRLRLQKVAAREDALGEQALFEQGMLLIGNRRKAGLVVGMVAASHGQILCASRRRVTARLWAYLWRRLGACLDARQAAMKLS